VAGDGRDLARALHDDPLQLLIVALMRLDLLRAGVDDAVVADVDDVRDTVRTACDHLRAIIEELPPG